MRRRNTRRQHDEKIDRKILARFEHVTNPVHAQDVGVLMRVDHHRPGAVRSDRADELRDRHHRAFDVKMSLDQTRREVSAGKIDNFICVVITKTDHAAIIHRHIRGVHFSAEHVYDLRVLEKFLRGFLSPRDRELVLDLSHLTGTDADFSGDARRCSIAMKIASGVAGDGSGTWPPDLPKAATASRIASRTEIASINGGSPTALLP